VCVWGGGGGIDRDVRMKVKRRTSGTADGDEEREVQPRGSRGGATEGKIKTGGVLGYQERG